MASNEDWLNELASRTGASAESSDLSRMREFEEGIAAGTTTQDQYDRYKQALESQYRLRGGNTPGDQRVESTNLTRQGYGSEMDERLYGSGGGGSRTSQSWIGGGGGGSNPASSMFPDWYRDLMERQMKMAEDQRAENKARAESLFTDLSGRAKQTLAIDWQNDPGIRQQADAFSANARRAQRNYLGDIAESSGPLANLTGEQRMANERYGQMTGQYEAGLVGSEIAARRNEIADAYRMIAGLVSGDQARTMQMDLAAMDAAGREAGLGVQYDLGLRGNDLGLRNLGLQDWDRQMYWDMLQRGMF